MTSITGGATTLSITTLSIMTFSIIVKNATLSIVAEHCFAECFLCCLSLMLSVFILDVVMLSVAAPYRWQKSFETKEAELKSFF